MITSNLIILFAFQIVFIIGVISTLCVFKGKMGKVYKIMFLVIAVKLFVLQLSPKNTIRRYTTGELLELNGYPFESHYVTTSDGYILNLHRIAFGKHNKTNGKVVFLAHGFLTSSMMWLFAGPGRSLGFILADEGYDVWMSNNRGNEYSRNHTSLDPEKDSEFWNFSWEEIGHYDLSASIDYVLNYTNQRSLHFSALSEGTTVMYVLLSTKPEYNEKIKLYVHMGPVAFIGHTKTPILTQPAAILEFVKDMVPITKGREVFPGKSSFTQSVGPFCGSNIGRIICEKLYQSVGGYSVELNATLIPEMVLLGLSGGSSKQFVHFLQVAKSGRFRQYDYGETGNLIKYGQIIPPDYDLSKVTAPGYLIYASHDDIVDKSTDLLRLYESLGNCLGKFMIPTFNHIDFLLGITAPSVVYFPLVKLFDQH